MVRVPQGRSPPQGLEFEKNEKSKIREGVLCAPRAQHGRVPVISVLQALIRNQTNVTDL